MNLSVETLKNKNFLGGLGALLISAYLILLVLEEYILLGMFGEIPYLILGIVLLVVGLLFVGLGAYGIVSENNKLIAWIVLGISIAAATFLLIYQVLRLWNLASHFLFGYLGYLDSALDPIAKIFGFIYAEINTNVIILNGIYALLSIALFGLLGIILVLKRENRGNQKLALYSGLLLLIGVGLLATFSVLNFIAKATNGQFSIFKAAVGLIDFNKYTLPIVGDVSLGTILTGIGFLFIDPKIASVYEMYLLAGVLPFAILNMINALGFMKEV